MTTNRNEMERYELNPEQLHALFKRSCEQQEADAAERRRVAGWPSLVDQLLNKLMGRADEDRDALAGMGSQLAGIDARLTALEQAMGIGRG